MPRYAAYLRRTDGILVSEAERLMLRDQINNAVEVLEGLRESLIGECIPVQYADRILDAVLREAKNG